MAEAGIATIKNSASAYAPQRQKERGPPARKLQGFKL